MENGGGKIREDFHPKRHQTKKKQYPELIK